MPPGTQGQFVALDLPISARATGELTEILPCFQIRLVDANNLVGLFLWLVLSNTTVEPNTTLPRR